MVAPVFRSEATTLAQQKVEAFEKMMQNMVKESKNYKSPFVVNPKKEIVIHDPKKNPFAPLYRPDKEILYKLDKYHQFEPPKDFRKKVEVKEFKVAAGGAPEKNPDNFNKINNFSKYENIKNDSEIYNSKKIYNNKIQK